MGRRFESLAKRGFFGGGGEEGMVGGERKGVEENGS